MTTFAWANISYLARLIKRFNLAKIRAGQVSLPFVEMIMPVTSIDQVLIQPTIAAATLDLTAAGNVTAVIVPQGKRWRLKACYLDGCVASTQIGIANPTSSIIMWIETGLAATAHVHKQLDLPMDQLWRIVVGTGGNVGDGNRALSYIYEEEDAY